jgi:hypothetical protein
MGQSPWFQVSPNADICVWPDRTSVRYAVKGEYLLTDNWDPGDDAFKALWQGLGFASPLEYLFEHEILHILVPRIVLGLEVGYTHFQAASGRHVDPTGSAAEEKLIYYGQEAFHRHRTMQEPFLYPEWDKCYRQTCALQRLASPNLLAAQPSDD